MRRWRRVGISFRERKVRKSKGPGTGDDFCRDEGAETQAGVVVSCTMYPGGARVLLMLMLYPSAMVRRSW